MPARQRPATARAAADGMKLHRRTLRLAGREHTVIGLRPGTTARFGTNLFHETWHVLSDRHGAQVLARLLWGLSYQARPGTLLLIDRPFLVPTPFDADPADPIVVLPDRRTPFGRRAARDLKARLPLRSAPDGTVRWRTYGLDAALTDVRGWTDAHVPYWRPERGRVRRTDGLIVLQPDSTTELRLWALWAATLDATGRFPSDHTYLGPWRGGHSGEIQIFRDFRRDVGIARRARADVLARPDAPKYPDLLRPRIWRQGHAIRCGRSMKIENCRNLDPTTAERLNRIGIRTLDDLARTGPVEAFLGLRDAAMPGLTRTMLWALEGALTDTDRRAIPAARKEELLSELERSARGRRRR
ncbi:TfoX/Sxy family DNA transformation protein [Thermomonospora umbrina]|uniref:TfoX-like protein n=1 Tax=Thermomonospora umbrina TaxID=111806 RepID=A0A3D9T2J1_9ACTN|nr:TfoX/Sxy family DNA transformation protein [Thermomonospora umbrina]REF01061.1 TfoX-like protein [Thermomonospora umbrina]